MIIIMKIMIIIIIITMIIITQMSLTLKTQFCRQPISNNFNVLTLWTKVVLFCIIRNKLLCYTSVLSSNSTMSPFRPRISLWVHWIWLRAPFLRDMGLWIAFLTMIYAQSHWAFLYLLNFIIFAFLHTLKSTLRILRKSTSKDTD